MKKSSVNIYNEEEQEKVSRICFEVTILGNNIKESYIKEEYGKKHG